MEGILTHLLLAEEAGEQAGDRETHDVWLVERSRGVVDGRTEELAPSRLGGHWACGLSSSNVEGDYSGPFCPSSTKPGRPAWLRLRYWLGAGAGAGTYGHRARLQRLASSCLAPSHPADPGLSDTLCAGPNFQCTTRQGPPRDHPGNAERGTLMRASLRIALHRPLIIS